MTLFNKHDIRKNSCQLFGRQARCGYDWWWHSFTAHNAVTGEEKAFFIEFFACNPELGKDEPVLGQLTENRLDGIRPSYVMVKAGAWGENAVQLHRFFGWSKAHVDMGVPFAVSADDCFLSETETHGSVSVSAEEAQLHPELMCGSGSMSWDLKIEKQIPFNLGYATSGIFRRIQLFEMAWHVEGMKSKFSGEIVFNGEKYIVSPENCYGYADKNWGRDFTSPWVWISSNNLVSEITGKKLTESVFDIGGGRPKIGPLAINRKLLSAFWYEGKGYEFNFSKFHTFTRTRFDCRETDAQIIWHIEQKTWRNRMVADITCEKKDMLLVNYEAPTGEKRHNRLWNGGNGCGTVELYHDGRLVDRIRAENVGCEYGEFQQF